MNYREQYRQETNKPCAEYYNGEVEYYYIEYVHWLESKLDADLEAIEDLQTMNNDLAETVGELKRKLDSAEDTINEVNTMRVKESLARSTETETIHDRDARAAMQGILTDYTIHRKNVSDIKEMARISYVVADAMQAERASRGNG